MYFVFALLALALALTALWYRRKENAASSMPPGPPPLPVIGNLFDIPRKAEALAYSRLADKYGNMVYMSVLGKNIYLVSSVHILNDLFNKRSANYSDRPYSTMLHKLMDLEWIFAFRSYGNVWREQRKLFHSQFQETVASDYMTLQVNSARDLARAILASPEDLIEHLHTHAASVLMGMTYGLKMTPQTSEVVRMADEVAMASTKVAVPGSYLVEFLPIMQYIPEWLIPGGGFRKDARECKEKAAMARDVPFEAVVNDIAKGIAKPSFTSKALARDSRVDQQLIKSCAGVAYLGMFSFRLLPIMVALQTFVLAMVAHPDVLTRAQREADSVMCQDRLPTFDDRDSLPYINGIVHEVLRWNPPAPFAIPHMSVNDDEYQGYHIPAKSIIVGNLWKILHDPEVFPEPMRFIPERFIRGDQDHNLEAIMESFMAVYGLGRRTCPGRFVAFQQLFITIATIISLFDITAGVDENGKPNKVEPDFTFGLVWSVQVPPVLR
ncbi:hypothetical protein HYPSUDRAFT_148882 [Hypholoma sublateritium FD-334 SS-4]|uniref:Cytochrome P450 n=1 Tax=Hypholoma sublateritium (strain FD-334 SS-4) TaxID=945553 RepID=A0A0D2N8X4_HYPSF|nr:hypothetical protein HYPSUDRAFT_148882 [Hypholoma sublateritium FD-334 SS-4]